MGLWAGGPLYLYGDDGVDLPFGRLQSPVGSQSPLDLYGPEVVEDGGRETEPPLRPGSLLFLERQQNAKNCDLMFTRFLAYIYKITFKC